MATQPLRTSAPSLVVVGRRIMALRDELVAKWSRFLEARQAGTVMLGPPATERLLKLIVDLLAHMSGPMRREADDPWFAATELYGRLAAVRGLSAGEVVEELQYLRELLTKDLADILVALPVRQQLPSVLRINRVLDRGVANAVVGYTDALVATMFSREGVPVPTTDHVHEL
ncbi:MAG: hypothetical protein B7Z72_05695, partial [Gemmatimonadetes bacterium 21-71-4]